MNPVKECHVAIFASREMVSVRAPANAALVASKTTDSICARSEGIV